MSSRSAGRFRRRIEEARALQRAGRVSEAVRTYVELRQEAPDHPDVLHGLGVALGQGGRLADAAPLLLRARELAPDEPDIAFDLAVIREMQGRRDESIRLLYDVVDLDPDRLDAWVAIAVYERDRGNYPSAVPASQKAASLAPDRVDLALMAAEMMEPEPAAELLLDRLARNPQATELLLPLAEVLLRSGRYPEAEATLLTLRKRGEGDQARVTRHLGAIYSHLRRFPEAVQALEESIEFEPDHPATWSLLVTARLGAGDQDGGADALRRALELSPFDAKLLAMHANEEQAQGYAERAREQLSQLPEEIRCRADVRMVSAMLLPPIVDSNEEIDRVRERWMEGLADVEANPTYVPEPWSTVGFSPFFLGYHGREDRAHVEQWARASLAASPHLDYTAPRLGGDGKKIRIGFLSAYMRKHSVGRVLIGIMKSLDRSIFDVTLLQLPDKVGGGQEFGEAAADRTVRVPMDLNAARKIVEEQHLDFLMFSDLHLNPFSDSLSFSRFAPVQATTWGHPGTGGRASIDYWISCEDWELEGNERLYTEELVRLPLPLFVYDRPDIPKRMKSRAEFGLREEVRLYGCLQSMFKLHPDFDGILAEVLDRDPQGRLVFVDFKQGIRRQQLERRLSRVLDVNRIDFLPTIPNRDYLAAVSCCEVMLDPIHFGGANTSLEAFACGKPVVTLRGDQMRNRVTGGFYRQMGYETLVAGTHQEYVQLALRLAQDRSFAQETSQEILARKDVLFENLAPVHPFEAFVQSVVTRTRTA